MEVAVVPGEDQDEDVRREVRQEIDWSVIVGSVIWGGQGGCHHPVGESGRRVAASREFFFLLNRTPALLARTMASNETVVCLRLVCRVNRACVCVCVCVLTLTH